MNNLKEKDIWRLVDNDSNSQNYGRNFIFDFSCYESPAMKSVVKEYIWKNHMTGNRTLKSLIENMRRLKVFNSYCIQYDIRTFRELTHDSVNEYRTYLSLYQSPFSGSKLSYSSQRMCFSALKTLIGWCHAFLPEAVPDGQIFTGNEYRQNYGNRLKIGFIPDEIMEAVNLALTKERNPYLRNGIRILECTGMRLGDLLLLRTDCISEHPVSGWTISWYDHKNRRNMENLPIPDLCRKAVEQLIEVTAGIRNEAEGRNRELLFIYKPEQGNNKTPVVGVSKATFTKWCGNFCKNHGICDSAGNPYRITSHMFRRTLATDMLSKGTNLNVIKETLGHSSPATTRQYYADVKSEERKEMFDHIGILGSIGDIGEKQINEQTELQWFKENCSGGARLSDGYCTLPIRNGEPCGRFLSRQKCYMCSRYVTTVDDLETHRNHLSDLQELLKSNIYGEHFASHILPTVAVLKEIIRRLEVLKDER